MTKDIIERVEKEYDVNNINEWTLGIIATTLLHAQTQKFGDDASYLTKKLRELVLKEITFTQEERDRSWRQRIGNFKKVGYGDEIRQWNEAIDSLLSDTKTNKK